LNYQSFVFLKALNHSLEPIHKKSGYLARNLLKMERIVNIHIQKLPEGYYLATSDNIQGLVAQGRTVTETLEIARDIVKKLLEAQTFEIN